MQALVEGFDASATDLAAQMDAEGAACLSAVVADEWLHAAQECVRSYLPPHGQRELFIEDPDRDTCAFVHRLVIDQRLESLLESLAVAGYPALSSGHQDIECAVRILLGSADPLEPLWFHYDRSVVTMIVPIVIPDVGSGVSGELILCPNRRPYRRSVVTNIIEKAVTQNDFYRKRFVSNLDDVSDSKVIPMQPGNMYLFWGYRTYHATFPCAPDTLRATVILHYGNVHGRSRILAAAQRWSGLLHKLGRLLR